MEVVGSTLGVLASVEQVITTTKALKERYVAFRQNTHHVTRLLSSYRSFATDLYAMDNKFRGKPCKIAPSNRCIFARHFREMMDSFDSARNTLHEVSSNLSRGRFLRFLRAKSQAQVCKELLSELHRVEELLFDINSFLATADVINLVTEDIHASEDPNTFRPSFPVIISSPDLVLDFDAVDSDGTPNTVEGRVKRQVLEGNGDNRVVVLQGMAGVGKSSVLRQLALDTDIRQHFLEGIHVIALGAAVTHGLAIQELLNAISESGGVAIAKKLQSEATSDTVIRAFVKWFQSRECLFLIDDFWSANRPVESFLKQLAALVRHEDRGRVVVTTRDLQVASYGHVIAMKPQAALSAQSKSIMLQYAREKEEDINDAETRNSIEELLLISGGLPVILALVGKGVGMLSMSYGGRKKIAWQKYLRRLRARGENLMTRNMGGYSNLALTFAVSMTLLEQRRSTMPVPTSKSFAEMHKALCVLKKQGSAPVAMLRLLWKLQNEQQAGFIAREFARLGLAEISVAHIDNEYYEYLHLHDIFHDFSISQAKPYISTIHDELLNAYSTTWELRRQEESKFIAWWLPSLKPDYYIHANLCRHLRLAKRETELLDLLCRPEWLKRQLDLSKSSQVEEDFLEGIRGLRKLKSQDLHITERDLKHIAGAVRLSSTFLLQNPSELFFQLAARLPGEETSSKIVRDFLKRVEGISAAPLLKPLDQCLATPGGPLKTIKNTGSPLSSLCMSVDGKQGLCGSDDGYIHVVNLGSASDVFQKWKAHDAIVSCMSLSTDGCKLVTGSWDCTLKVWNLETKRCVAICSLHNGSINAVQLTPDNETVLSASEDSTVKVWKITSPEREIFSFKGHYAWVSSVVSSPDGRLAFSGGEDQNVLVWSLSENGKVYSQFPGHKRSVKCLTVSIDGTLLATGSGSVIRIWDLTVSSEEPSKVLDAPAGSLRALVMSPDGSRLASGYDDNSVRVWDLERGEQVGGDLISHSDSVTGLSLSADGNTAVSCSWDGSLRVWDLTDLHSWRPRRAAHEAEVTCLALTSDGRQLVSGSKDRSIKVWDVASGRQTEEEYLQAHDDDISDVAVTFDGRKLVSASSDKTIRIRDRQTGTEVALVTGHEQNFSCSAISADGKQACTGSYDLTIRIWDLTKCDGSHEILTGHTHQIRRVFLSADEKRIISASEVEVRVWEIERGKCVQLIHQEDPHLLSQADLFAAVGESWRRRTNVNIPLNGRQILWNGNDGKNILGTLEADITAWRFAEPLNTVCVGLSSGQVAFFKLST